MPGHYVSSSKACTSSESPDDPSRLEKVLWLIDWSSLQVGTWWPLLLTAIVAGILTVVWSVRKGALFPDLSLLSHAVPPGGIADRLPLIMGLTVLLLLMLSLMGIAVSRSVVVDKQTRDFLVIVDTSRSMRKNTSLLREQSPPTYDRGASLFTDRDGIYAEVSDPSIIPQLARYELARESLLQFIWSRREEDRVQLIYFNSEVFVMSAFTSNFEFLEDQLSEMDSHVVAGTDIGSALDKGLDMLERHPSQNRRAVILLTDAELEASDARGLQQRFDRLSESNVALYTLWIATDTAGDMSGEERAFLQNARTIGRIFTINNLEEGHLDEALAEIGELEDYAYEEFRTETIDLSRYVYVANQWLMLLWILLLATVYHPLTDDALFERK